jgi:hypothetical protein
MVGCRPKRFNLTERIVEMFFENELTRTLTLIGYRVGDEFEWTVPYGLRRLKVTHVHFQPEAALAAAA